MSTLQPRAAAGGVVGESPQRAPPPQNILFVPYRLSQHNADVTCHIR